MKTIVLTVLLLLPLSAFAGSLAPQSEKEIAALLEFVRTAPCRFNRNGSWYDARDAAEHIDTKYRYAVDQGLVHSAEDFIQYVADKSSLTGIPYTVQCQGGSVLRCADWLRAELQRIRNQ